MRVGRSLGRTLYLVNDEDDPKSDTFIGVVDTRELAAEVCRRWNKQVV